MKKLFIILSLTFSIINLGHAQENERFKTKPQKISEKTPGADDGSENESVKNRFGISDRLIFGGNLSFNFGTNKFIYIAPTVAYKISEEVFAGGGFIYQYSSFTTAYNTVTNTFEPFEYETSVYGPKAFAFYSPIEILYFGTQVEYLNHDVATSLFGVGELTKQWTTVLFLEVGYLQKIGTRGLVQFGIKYNVLHDYDSPYNGAFVPSIGVFF